MCSVYLKASACHFELVLKLCALYFEHRWHVINESDQCHMDLFFGQCHSN